MEIGFLFQSVMAQKSAVWRLSRGQQAALRAAAACRPPGGRHVAARRTWCQSPRSSQPPGVRRRWCPQTCAEASSAPHLTPAPPQAVQSTSAGLPPVRLLFWCPTMQMCMISTFLMTSMVPNCRSAWNALGFKGTARAAGSRYASSVLQGMFHAFVFTHHRLFLKPRKLPASVAGQGL